MEIKLFNKYSFKARLLPAVFTILFPLIVFNHFYTSPELSRLLGAFQGSETITNLSISLILIFYLSQFARFIGKNIFEKLYFKEEMRMPTTQFMLFSDSQYTHDYKLRFAKEVKDRFSISLSTEQEELSDPITARKRIIEAMSSVRKYLFENKFLLQHNIEYGAMRNTIEGSLIGLIICVINSFFFYYIVKVDFAIYSSIVLGSIYLLILVFSKFIINFYGKSYAKILFQQFIG